MTNPPPLIAVVGLTASGKSQWAVDIAERLSGEIISLDSRQIYRRLNIGTAKPTPQMLDQIPHHCVDLVDPAERYSLGEYLKAARTAISDIQHRGKQPVAVGGSGQHLRALLEGWQIPPVPADPQLRAELEEQSTDALVTRLQAVDPTAASRIDPRNRRRLIRALEVHQLTGLPISQWQQRRAPIPFTAIAPDRSLAEIDERITRRTALMFNDGFVEEVRALLAEGIPAAAPGFDSIGYREVLAHLNGELTLAETEAAVVQATRRFARRQRSWFRRADPRIHWSREIAWELLAAEAGV